MALLDGMPSTKAEWESALAAAAPLMQQFVESEQMTPKMRSVIDMMSEGLSLADIMQLTPAHRDALVLYAARTIQAGDLAKAADFLEMLYRMDAFDARVPYMLGAIRQHQGDHVQAARLYIGHLALNATNHEVHHRLGECFLAAREHQNALDCFEAAEALAETAGDKAAAAKSATMQGIAREALGKEGAPPAADPSIKS
jgi:tetratricopeptide (TPR) repeat protein